MTGRKLMHTPELRTAGQIKGLEGSADLKINKSTPRL